MMDIFITNSFIYKLDAKQWKFRQPYPPLGTLLAAAVLRDAQVPLTFFDNSLQDNSSAVVAALQKRRPSVVIIYEDGFNYLTKMCLTVMREVCFEIAKEAKRIGAVVVVCSSDASDHYEKYFVKGVDYVIRGEGEETLKELVLAINSGDDPNNIAGIAYMQQGTCIVTPSRPVMKELDMLPMPAWDLLNLDPYRRIWNDNHGYFSLNIATTRGCPFKCNWCAKPIYGNRYNVRSPKKVLDEIEMLLSNYGPDHFWMCDDIFGLKPDWIQQFRDEVVRRNLTFSYKIQSRADLLLESDTITALAQSGAETIWIGAESGSQKILDAMDKGTTLRQIEEATHLIKRNGMRVAFFLQFGYPGETAEDINATLQMVLSLMPDEIGISISYPLPGTVFYERVKNQLKEKQNWKDSDDLSAMFSSTFPASYYKVLHHYIHSCYRKRKGWKRLTELLQSPFDLTLKDFKIVIGTFYFGLASIIQSIKMKRLQVIKYE